jgi:uncharacterized membrane protein HdeD (DUF308 family)
MRLATAPVTRPAPVRSPQEDIMTEASVRGPDATGNWPSVAEEVRSEPFPWWSVLIPGIFSIALGLAVLIWPDITLRIMAALVGVWLFVAGLARIIGAFLPTGRTVAGHILSGIVGLILLVGGLMCLRNLVTRLAVLALIFATTWILSGIAEIITALASRGATRAGLLIVGILSVLAGGLFLFAPGLSLGALVAMTAISSLVVGIGEVILALALRRQAA